MVQRYRFHERRKSGRHGQHTRCMQLDAGGCTTQEFIKAVQFNGLCGVFNWRMPSAREIMTIMHLGATPFWEATIQTTLDRMWGEA